VLVANCHLFNASLGYVVDAKSEGEEALRLIHFALGLDQNDPEALALAGSITAFFTGDYESAIDFVDLAVASNPNLDRAWRARGWTYKFAGQHQEAIQSFERSIRLSPLDPRNHLTFAGMVLAFVEMRRFDEAVAAAKKALRQNQSYSGTYRGLVSALAHLGREAETRDATARLLEVDPTFTVSGWIARGGQANSKLLIEGLRKAGLPE
jgi:adenylate cyclase